MTRSFMTRSLPLALSALLVTASVAAAETSQPRPFALLGPGNVRDGRLMAPFYDYVIWPHAVAAEDKVFCVFSSAQARPIAMAYDEKEKSWAGPVQLSELGLKNDDHGNPALCIDRRGFLHVFHGCHGGPMRHTRSTRPHDIASWDEQPPPTPRATYPQVMRMADGGMLLFYRAGGHMEPWTLRASGDDGRTWGDPQRIVEMRLDPPDRLAAAYCFFLPGAERKTVHVFWCHKDDNAARVTEDRPHPWRPLKYPGLHEAVYRYNIYYMKRRADGTWRNAAGQPVSLPVSKAEADTKCLVFDSGHEFTLGGRKILIDSQDRPYIHFRVGVYDWVRQHGRSDAAIVPVTDRFAHPEAGRWQVSKTLPDDWPKGIVRLGKNPGVLAPSEDWPGGHWTIYARRTAIRPGAGCSVYLYHDEQGYAAPAGGPVMVY